MAEVSGNQACIRSENGAPVSQAESFFHGKKNLRIYRRSWLPAKPRGTVVLVHGLGEHSGRYQHVAEVLVEAGCAVYALDHRGHGKSEGPRGFIDSFANAVDDIDLLVNHAHLEQRTYSSKPPVFLLGHSMGGALSLSYALKHGNKLAGLILSGSAVGFDGASPLMKPLSKLLSVFAPRLGMFAIDPSLLSRDPATIAAYTSDPLNAHGKVPARTLGEIVNFVEWLPAGLPLIKLPLLVMHGSADRLAGVAGSEMIMNRVGSKDKALKIYQGLHHEIFNELPADRERVLKDLSGWIGARMPARAGKQ